MNSVYICKIYQKYIFLSSDGSSKSPKVIDRIHLRMHIHFAPEFEQLIKNGSKTATTRLIKEEDSLSRIWI